MEQSTEQMLKEHCQSIADDLEAIVNMNYYEDDDGNREEDWEDDDGEVKEGLHEVSMMDFFTDSIYDLLYMVRSAKTRRGMEYCHARIMVACGGPDIWIDTRRGVVEGHWGWTHTEVELSKAATDAVDEAMDELFNC